MPELSSIPKYYAALVGYVDKVIKALEQCDDVRAKTLLIQGLGEAENISLEMWADE